MASSGKYSVHVRVATSISDFLFLRQLRNQVRDQMTNSTEPIGYLQQFRFYRSKPPNIKAYVGWIGAKRAGYLLMRREIDDCYITEVVDERFRRAGVATQLIRYAQAHCAELTAEILLTNSASIKLHESAGFQFVGDDGRVAKYRFKRER